MAKTQRREFLKKSLAGICGAAVIPGVWNPSSAQAGETSAPAAIPSLPSRPLGKTGIMTPLLSMGTGSVTSPEFIRQGYDAGIKLFFSATYYGHGNNERLVGQALKDLPRDSFVVGTAADPEGLNPRTGTMPKDMKPESYVKTAEYSLKRFRLDHIDIMLVPYAAKREFIIFDPIMEAMTTLKKQGKIRFAGIATHGSCEEALRAAADAKIYDVAMTAYNYKIENKDAMNDALAYAAKAGLGLLAFKTTYGAAEDKNRTRPFNSNAALKWVLQNQNISSIVSGMTSVDELRKNLGMLRDLKMTDRELEDLRLADLRPELSLYCRQCQKCLPQCPANLDIPTLMRSYMYAYGYRDAAQARHTLDSIELSGDPCGKCEACSVACASGFDVKDRIQDVARLRNVPVEFLKG